MEELTAKNFAQNDANEIIGLCDDIKYAQNRDLRIYGIEKIQGLACKILEHLDYLELKKNERSENSK